MLTNDNSGNYVTFTPLQTSSVQPSKMDNKPAESLTDILKSTLPLLMMGSKDKTISELIGIPILTFAILKLLDHVPNILYNIYIYLRINILFQYLYLLTEKYTYEVGHFNTLFNTLDTYVENKYPDKIKYMSDTAPYISSKFAFQDVLIHDGDLTLTKMKDKYIITANSNSTIMNKLNEIKEYVANMHIDSTMLLEWDQTLKSFQNDRDIFCHKNISNVFLSKDNYKLLNYLDRFMTETKEYIKFGIPHKLGILMHGTPGCGKSSIIYAIANIYKKSIYKIDFKSLISKQDFTIMKAKIPYGCVVVLEDVDCCEFMHKRQTNANNKLINHNITNIYDYISYEDTSLLYCLENEKAQIPITSAELADRINSDIVNIVKSYESKLICKTGITMIKQLIADISNRQKILLSDILEFLDGYHDLNDCIVIMTTNHVNKLDDAVIRHGRMDFHMEFKLCDAFQFHNIFKYYTNHSVEDIDSTFVFEENTYSTATIINQYILPNVNDPAHILELLKSNKLALQLQ